MLKPNKILFPTDFSRCAEQALAHAIFLSRKYKAELHLLHIIFPFDNYVFKDQSPFLQMDIATPLIDETINYRLSEMIKPYDTTGLKTKRKVTRNIRPASFLLDYVVENEIGLIVMGTHGFRGLQHLFLGSVTNEVVRFAKCPVLTIRELKEPKPISRSRILVPIDFSEYAMAALAQAKEIASLYGAEVQLLHICEESIHPQLDATSKDSQFELKPGIRERTGQALEKFYNRTPGPKVEAQFYVVGGKATREIVRFSGRHNSDLIVMAMHQLTSMKHFPVRSIGEAIGRDAACPVLTI